MTGGKQPNRWWHEAEAHAAANRRRYLDNLTPPQRSAYEEWRREGKPRTRDYVGF
jgi:hypothetical protein